jgi:4-hydroxybenzoate polyprenyltransferase
MASSLSSPHEKTLRKATRSLPRIAVDAMRPHQWTKNILVFVPMVLAHAINDPWAWINACLAFIAFCMTASGTYILNDFADLAVDRQHPVKRRRSLARGALPINIAITLALLLMIAGFTISATVAVLPLIVIYIVASTSYTLILKKFALVDVFVLAGFYVLRLLAGGVATGHPISLWLLTFAGFLFLSLGLVKRVAELKAIAHADNASALTRRGYQPGDSIILQILGISSTFASGVILALFVGSASASAEYRSPELLWAIVPLILFWQCWLWLATMRGHMLDDPLVYAVRDRVSWVLAVALLVVFVTASYGPDIPNLGMVQF